MGRICGVWVWGGVGMGDGGGDGAAEGVLAEAGEGVVGHEGLEAGEAFGGAGCAGAFVGDVFAAGHGEEGLLGRGDVGGDGRLGGREAFAEVPAAHAAVEGGGAHLGGADFAGAVHDLPEPDEHFMPGFGHEEEGWAMVIVEFGDAG